MCVLNLERVFNSLISLGNPFHSRSASHLKVDWPIFVLDGVMGVESLSILPCRLDLLTRTRLICHRNVHKGTISKKFHESFVEIFLELCKRKWNYCLILWIYHLITFYKYHRWQWPSWAYVLLIVLRHFAPNVGLAHYAESLSVRHSIKCCMTNAKAKIAMAVL